MIEMLKYVLQTLDPKPELYPELDLELDPDPDLDLDPNTTQAWIQI